MGSTAECPKEWNAEWNRSLSDSDIEPMGDTIKRVDLIIGIE
ncbi:MULTISPECIES: hypothetical protein [Myroides]|nr:MULTISPECIES: hypothetical protein [Myroides]UVD78977.1 hypothetical protein NWE55_12710 [Myroides albus]